MASRPYWKGHIRLSLVSFGVQLFTATSEASRISFHQYDRGSGQRIRYQKVVEGGGAVEADDIVKGYEIEKGKVVQVEADEIDALKVQSRHTIDLVRFVEPHAIDPLYFDSPYFVVPDGAMAQEAFRVIRKALGDAGKVALGQLVLLGREHLVALQPCGRGMVLATLRSADEVKRGAPFFEAIEDGPVDDDQLALAKELVRRKVGPFEPEAFTDHYEKALRELIEAKAAGQEVRTESEGEPAGEVIDLMTALKRSLGGESKAGGKRPKGPATVTKLPERAAKKPAPAKKATAPDRKQGKDKADGPRPTGSRRKAG